MLVTARVHLTIIIKTVHTAYIYIYVYIQYYSRDGDETVRHTYDWSSIIIVYSLNAIFSWYTRTRAHQLSLYAFTTRVRIRKSKSKITCVWQKNQSCFHHFLIFCRFFEVCDAVYSLSCFFLFSFFLFLTDNISLFDAFKNAGLMFLF